MQKLIYKTIIRDGAIYTIEKLGGIQLAEKYFKLNKSLNTLNFISDEIKNELINFFQAKKSPPHNFKQFNEILSFYYNSENKLTQEKVDQIIDFYNSSSEISFDEFYESLKSISEREIKEKYKIGGLTCFRIKSLLIQSFELNELLNNEISRESPIAINYGLMSQTIDEFIIQENPLNNNLLKSILKICSDYFTFLNFLAEDKSLAFIESTISELEISKFRICTNNLMKAIYLLKENDNIATNNNSIIQLKGEIKILHSTLLNKYADLLQFTPDDLVVKKSRLKSKFETITKLFNTFERD